MDLSQIIKCIGFDNMKIGVKGVDHKHFCYFGLTYYDKDGELQIYQNGDVYLCLGDVYDDQLEDYNLEVMEKKFNAKHGVALKNIKCVVEAYDSVSISLSRENLSQNEKSTLLEDIQNKISEDCKEFNDPSNIGKWIAWYFAIINHPEDYVDAKKGKKTRKITDVNEFYVNVVKGNYYSFIMDDTEIIEPRSFAVQCEDEGNDKIKIFPQDDYLISVIYKEADIVSTVHVNAGTCYYVSPKSLSFDAQYKVVRNPGSFKLNITNQQNNGCK